MRVAVPLVASALLLGSIGVADASPLRSRDRGYAACLVTQVQRIGAATDEDHYAVLGKAKRNCASWERALDMETGSTRNYGDPAGNWFGTSKDELIERSERVAVEALFKARARLARAR